MKSLSRIIIAVAASMLVLLSCPYLAFAADDPGPPAVKGNYRSKIRRASVQAPKVETSPVRATPREPLASAPRQVAAVGPTLDTNQVESIASAVSAQVLKSMRTEQARLTDHHKADLDAHLERLKREAKTDLNRHLATTKSTMRASPPAVATTQPIRQVIQSERVPTAAPGPRYQPPAAPKIEPRYWQYGAPYAAQSYTPVYSSCPPGGCPTGVTYYIR